MINIKGAKGIARGNKSKIIIPILLFSFLPFGTAEELKPQPPLHVQGLFVSLPNGMGYLNEDAEY